MLSEVDLWYDDIGAFIDCPDGIGRLCRRGRYADHAEWLTDGVESGKRVRKVKSRVCVALVAVRVTKVNHSTATPVGVSITLLPSGVYGCPGVHVCPVVYTEGGTKVYCTDTIDERY